MATDKSCCCHQDDTDTIKSDDSGDENSNCTALSLPELILRNNECYMCNGFYESCFENPVCGTCHAFLFPDYAVEEQIDVLTEKNDDGDSGNDEPSDVIFVNPGVGLFERAEFMRNPGDPDTPAPPADSLLSRLEILSAVSLRNKQPEFYTHIEVLPLEVLLVVFSYLDDISLWNAANVCSRWKTLITYEVPGQKWKDLTLRRFPLYKPLFVVDDWFQVYSNLMKNCSCFLCLKQMAVLKHPNLMETSWRRNRLRSELKILRSDPPDGIQAIPLDPPTCCHWQATIIGPTGSPYEGGLFFLYLQVPYSYPMCPPVVRFLTKIFHPNISRHGDVGIDSIHYNWSLALTLSKVLISIQSLLTDPYCEVCMEPEIGKLYTRDKSTFDIIAQQWTWRYAMPDLLC